MAKSAASFVSALDAEQRAEVQLPFRGDERMNWHYTPVSRKGLPLKRMTPAQRKLAQDLLRSALSERGYLKAMTIISLEEILREIEGSSFRDPELYFFSVFGTPSEKEPWGWRVDGHHLSVNLTVVPGGRIADTPLFFGSNPAEVREGPKKGLRPLDREEDLGRKLEESLNAEQRRSAELQGEAPDDIVTRESRRAEIKEKRGLRVGQMTASQREILLALLNEYAQNMTSALAEARVAKVHKGGLDEVVFAFKKGSNSGIPYYYRIQGASFLIEFDKTQPNHVHTVWRDFNGDWGEDLLAEHYRTADKGHGHGKR